MNFDNLNKWLTLLSNIGVLVGIFVVAIELRQTQTAMSAEASSTRAQMNIEIGNYSLENATSGIVGKIVNSVDISDQEEEVIRRLQQNRLRNFENLHYQYELGVLDQETWDSAYYTISRTCNLPAFKYLFPDWPDEPAAGRYRASFVALVAEGCN